MNKLRFLILAAAAGILLPFLLIGEADDDSENKDIRSVRVMCYNIHWALGMDKQYDVARIARVINEQKPDLVALQEVDVGVERSGRVHEVRELAKLTKMEARFGPTQHYQGGLFGNAILSKYPILDVEIHPLPYTESTAEKTTYPRGCIVVKVKGPNGIVMRVVSTHFQHNDEADRVAEAKAINKLLTDSELPTILAGDINATPESEPLSILLQEWQNATDDPASPTVPVVNPSKRIDYIFYRPAESFKLLKSVVIDEQVASDHLPVVADLRLFSRGK